MKNINLYNKYRPNSFDTIVGQKIIKTLLLNVFKNKKLIQSFLFFGPHGTGKTSLARILAKAWNCKNFNGQDICNSCENCNLINNNQTLDVIEIDAASNNGVEFIRELISNVKYLPLNLNKKIYIIDESHSLTSQSWNALLKIIEEPPAHVIFLFLTTKIKKIIPTILSRCQKLQFSYLTDDLLIELINKVASQEEKTIQKEVAQKIAKLSQGSARELLTMLEQLFLQSGDSISLSDYEKTFSFAGDADLLNLISCILLNKKSEALSFYDKFCDSGVNISSLFIEIFEIFVDLEVYEQTKDLNLLKKITDSEAKRLTDNKKQCLSFLNVLSSKIHTFNQIKNEKFFGKAVLLNLLHLNEADMPSKSEFKREILPETKPIFIPKEEIKVTEKINKETDIKTQEKEEIEQFVDKSTKNTMAEKTILNSGLEAIQVKSFAKERIFELETLKIFPQPVSDFLKPNVEIDYKKEVLYCFKKSKRALSEESFKILKECLSSTNKLSVIHNLFALCVEKYKLITSSVSSLVVFENEEQSIEFNKKVKSSEVIKELESVFKKNYHWFSIPAFQVVHYYKKAKETPASELSEDLIFPKAKNSLFEELMSVLKS